MAISIAYSLVGSGWSRCVVEDGEAKVELSASYLSDALANLILGATAALSGFRSCTFSFDEEPGEYRWVVQVAGPDGVRIDVLEFEEMWSERPDSDGKRLFSTHCTGLMFAKAVESAASTVLKEHGLEGYKEKWVEHSFPEHQLEALRQCIRASENDD